MLAFMWWMVIGLIAGGLARLLVPGRQPMSLIVTMALGLVGSVVGGFLSSVMFGENPQAPGFQTGGLIMSTIGAVVLLALYLRSTRARI